MRASIGTMRSGKIFHHKTWTFYALEGQVVLSDSEDNYRRVFALADWTGRMKAVGQTLKTIKEGAAPVWMQADTRPDRIALLNKMEECGKEAAEMGDPCDPNVQAFNRRHFRPRTTSSSVSMRRMVKGRMVSDAYPELPNLPMGEFTERSHLPLHGTALRRDLIIPAAHVPAHRVDRAGVVVAGT